MAEAKSASKPKMTPIRHPTKATTRSSVKKYPKIISFGHPAAFIRPISRFLCDIIRDVMNATMTAPAITMTTVKKRIKGERMFETPAVSLPSILKDIPKPTLSAESNRNRVEPADKAKLRMVKDV